MSPKYSKIFQVLTLVAVVGTLTFAYSNCGQVKTVQFDASHLASFAEKTADLTKKYQGQITLAFCEGSQNYSCIHKVFSRQEESKFLGNSQQSCVNMGNAEICPEVRHFSYNTSSADEACKDDCDETYDYEEFDCHLKLGLSEQGTYPLVTTDPDMTEAIGALYDACISIQSGEL